MLQAKRHQAIMSVIREEGAATVNRLAELFQISRETVRRDLTELAQQGQLQRTHGGAILPEQRTQRLDPPISTDHNESFGESFRARSNENPKTKTQIAKRALQMIKPGDCLLLDSSSTVWFLARQLPDIDLTVLTNSIHVIQTLACKAHIRTISLGGEYSAKFEAFCGPLTEMALREFYIDTLFFSCHGLSVEGGIRESNELHAKVKQAMLSASRQRVLLLDSSKLNRCSLVRICQFNQINTLITDTLTDRDLKQELAWHNVNVIEVSPNPQRSSHEKA